MALTHLLDTSAWLAHVFDEPGAEQVTRLFEDPEIVVGVSVLSLLETHGRFRAKGRGAEYQVMLETYRRLFDRILPVDEAIVLRAMSLRQTAPTRVPTIDTLIAATAAHHAAALVHRDPHLAALPDVAQVVLGREDIEHG